MCVFVCRGGDTCVIYTPPMRVTSFVHDTHGTTSSPAGVDSLCAVGVPAVVVAVVPVVVVREILQVHSHSHILVPGV